jgi:hypothetical protein
MIQGTNTIITIPITKKLGAQTMRPEILISYDFHFGIFDEVEDLMFATESKLFSIGTIGVPKLAKLKQPISPSSSTSLGLIEEVPYMLNQFMYYPFKYLYLMIFLNSTC